MNKNPIPASPDRALLTKASRSCCHRLAAVICLLLLGQWLSLPVAATDRTWVGTSNSRYWSTPGNWSPVGTPQNGDTLFFIDNSSVDVMTNDINGLTVGGLQFNKGKTLYGQSLASMGPIVQNNFDGNAVNLNFTILNLSNNITILGKRNAWGMSINCEIRLNGFNLYAATDDSNEGILRFQSRILGNGTFVGNGGTNIYLDDPAFPSYPIHHVVVNSGQLNFSYSRTNVVGESLEINSGGAVNYLDDTQIDWFASVLIHSGGALHLGSHFNYFRNLEMQGGLLDCGPDGSILISDEFRVNATNETAVIRGQCTIEPLSMGAYGPHPRLIVEGTVYPALDMQSIVYGLGGFSKSGSAAMYLSASNYFLGQLVISNGIVEARDNHALGQDYFNAGGDIKGVRLVGGTVLLRNITVTNRELYVDKSVIGSGTFGLPGAFITCVGSCAWSGNVILSTNLNIVGDMNFSGAISGPYGLCFLGGGTSTLGGNSANSYSGLTLVRCPLLQFAKPSGTKAYAGALEVGGGAGGTCEVRWLSSYQNLYAPVTLFDDGLLNLNSFAEDLGPITFTGGGIQTGSGELGIYGLVTVNESSHLATISGRMGLPSGAHEFRVLGDILTDQGLRISAAIVGAGQLTKTGGGTLALSGSSTYTGLTMVNQGLLAAENPNALGAGDPGTLVADGATLQLNSFGPTPMPERISIRGNGIATGIGALDVIGQVQLRNQFPSIYECLNLTTNAIISVADSTSKLLADGFISGVGPLTKIGPGTLIYTNSNPNTYSGPTIIQQGTLELRKPNNTLGVPGQLVLGPCTLAAAATARFYQTGAMHSGTNVTANANSLLDLNGNNYLFTQLNLNDGGSVQTGAGTLQFPGGGSITIGTSNAPFQGLRQGAAISGKLQLPGFDTLYCNVLNYGPAPLTSEPELAISAAISGTGNLVKNGGGALRLTGNNTFDGTSQVYSGEVDVMSGTLIVGGPTALGGTSGQTYVAGGASLALINGITVAGESLVLDTTNNAAVDNRGGNNTWGGPIQFARDSTFSVAQNWELNCSGAISGSGSLYKSGAGALRLSGSANNSFSGDVRVNAGTLLLAKSIAVTAVPGWVVAGESNGAGAPATIRNLSSYQIVGGILVNSQGLYDINGQVENTDYLGLNGNAKVETGTGILNLKANASVGVTPGTNTTAIINGHITMDSGTHLFTVDSGATTPGISDLLINAQIDQSTTAGIQKAGAGLMRLATNNTYTGTTTVSGGTLQVDGSQPSSPVQIQGARLQGSGTVGNILFSGNVAERLAPGGSPGFITCSNFNATAAGGGTLELELNGTVPGTGYDLLSVRGTVNLTGLKLSASLGFAPAVGTQFIIVLNDGSDAVTGTFSGLPQNGKLYISGQLFQINYAGSTGNDVVLTRLATPPPPTLTIESVSPNAIRVLWPTNDPPFRLVSATNLSAANWTSVTPSPAVIGSNNIVTNTILPGGNFYRLATP